MKTKGGAFMLVNLKEILEPAREQHYAVGHFNTLNVEMARAVIRAAEEAGAPVILGIEERQLDICPIDEFAAFSVAMAKKARVDVAVHFDRGRTFEKCIEAMKLGFTSVNYDCSELSMEENAEKVAELVRVAHAYGASVEAELGHVPEAINLSEEEKKDYHTTPDQAKRYVEMTGVDALAIAVGTAQQVAELGPLAINGFGLLEQFLLLAREACVLFVGLEACRAIRNLLIQFLDALAGRFDDLGQAFGIFLDDIGLFGRNLVLVCF